ncbi:MAG: hypothetical protein Q9214_000616 [Letrouitia sp. 1 TL-2023]
MDEYNIALENFREEWRKEVTARSKTKVSSHSNRGSTADASASKKGDQSIQGSFPSCRAYQEEDFLDGVTNQAYHDLEDREELQRVGSENSNTSLRTETQKEPRSALEHYEKAIEREDQGRMGDSLNLYRKAFRLDAGVDRIYKDKHFPPSSSNAKSSDPNPTNAAVTVPNTAHHSLEGPTASTVTQLILSFSSLDIPAAPSPVEGSPPSPCPISVVPAEILIQILLQTALTDVASFVRLSLVCKRLAYLVATEDSIWEYVCHGPQVGFVAMHYNWASAIVGAAIEHKLKDESNLNFTSLTLNANIDFGTKPPIPTSTALLQLSPKYPTYLHMFRSRPRIRFNGCYISTVNYPRPGAPTQSQLTWNTPVHIVTYYRYLRFFHDGTCVSLLTTEHPTDVVQYLTKENMHSHHNRESMLPSTVMRHALRGRWRLSGFEEEGERQDEGDVHIETEGVDPKYLYKLQLALRSAGGPGGTRNNKMLWKGFWSYNRLTDDWAAFTLRNDRAFFWSRVKSYGMGC